MKKNPEGELKTSQEWYDNIPKEFGFYIMDPDGWDRQNYQYSFYEELITKDEFIKRLQYSTSILIKGVPGLEKYLEEL